jgi:phage gpG-like protein
MPTTLELMDARLKRMSITVDTDKAEGALRVVAAQMNNFRPFYDNYLAPEVYRELADNFATAGRYVGGWRALSPAYAAWKMAHYGSRPLMVLLGPLRASLSSPGSRNAIYRVNGRTMVIGSTLPYATAHQRGAGRLPQRRIVFAPKPAITRALLKAWIVDSTKATGLPFK